MLPLTISASKQIIAEIGKDADQRDLDLCQRVIDACFASEDYKEGPRSIYGEAQAGFSGAMTYSQSAFRRGIKISVSRSWTSPCHI